MKYLVAAIIFALIAFFFIGIGQKIAIYEIEKTNLQAKQKTEKAKNNVEQCFSEGREWDITKGYCGY